MSGDEGELCNDDSDLEAAIAPDVATTAAISRLSATQLRADIERLNINVPAVQRIPPENEGAKSDGAVPTVQRNARRGEGDQAQRQAGDAPESIPSSATGRMEKGNPTRVKKK